MPTFSYQFLNSQNFYKIFLPLRSLLVSLLSSCRTSGKEPAGRSSSLLRSLYQHLRHHRSKPPAFASIVGGRVKIQRFAMPSTATKNSIFFCVQTACSYPHRRGGVKTETINVPGEVHPSYSAQMPGKF